MRLFTRLAFLAFLTLPFGFSQTWTDLGSGTNFSTAITCQSYATGCGAIIDSWGASAWDDARKKLYFHGGGHLGTVDNGVYQLDPIAKTWTNLWGPSTDVTTACPQPAETPTFHQPISVHTYTSLLYFPHADILWRYQGGGDYCGSSPDLQPTYIWEMAMSNPSAGWTGIMSSNTNLGGGTAGLQCAADIYTGIDEAAICFFPVGTGAIERWSLTTQTWTQICSSATCQNATVDLDGNPITSVLVAGQIAMDPIRRRLWFFCGSGTAYCSPSGSHIFVYDLTTGIMADATPQISGCNTILGSSSYAYPGAAWDPIQKKIVTYQTTGNVITTFDPTTLQCTDQTITAGGGGPGSTSGVLVNNGIGSKLVFAPSLSTTSLGKFIIVNGSVNDAYTVTIPEPAQGLGHTTITSSGPCLDVDGDGYGVGVGCLGPDADDTDPTVHSATQIISKYGSINAFIVHLNLQASSSPSPVYCVDGTHGSDTTGSANVNADTACSVSPTVNAFQTWGKVYSIAEPAGVPFITIFRAGTYVTQIVPNVSGTITNPVVIMSYPGESALIDYSGSSGGTVAFDQESFTVFTNMRVHGNPSGNCIHGGTGPGYPSTNTPTNYNVVTYTETWGCGTDSNLHMDNIQNAIVQYNVSHDPDPTNGQHDIYYGSTGDSSTNVNISNNVFYNVYTGLPNFQFNGRCFGCNFSGNLIYNSDKTAMAIYNGVTNSLIEDNLMFNTGSSATSQAVGIIFGSQDSQCQQTPLPSICGYNQTGNIIQNNTIWNGNLAIDNGADVLQSSAFEISENTITNSSGGACIVCGATYSNSFINNIIIGTGAVTAGSPPNGSPTILYEAVSGNTNPASYYLGFDTWTDNIFGLSRLSTAPTYILGTAITTFSATVYNCTSFASMALKSTGCSTSSPNFTNVSTSYWGSPQSFNFALQPGSPAIGGGTGNVLSTFDYVGNLRPTPPSLGALETIQSSGSLSSHFFSGLTIGKTIH